MTEFSASILTNKPRGTLYVGATGRLAQHRASSVPSFTRQYGLRLLVHVETFARPREAIAREKRLKKRP